MTKVPPLREKLDGGATVRLNFHEGQLRAWDSEKRYVFMLCGAQSGKTTFGPLWMDREIERKGAGDYLVATSTFTLLDQSLLPAYVEHFETDLRVAKWVDSKHALTFNQEVKEKGEVVRFPEANKPTRVFFGSAQKPESLESMTAKAIHLDECGQKQFRRDSWEAIERRGRIERARVLATTTLYSLGWLKTVIYDPWMAGAANIDVIQFDSVVNPAFSHEEWEEAKLSLPEWKFDLFYRGRFSKPAGLLYDCFDTASDVIEPFDIPPHWPRYVGHDFGSINFATLWIARDPTSDDLFVYREYKPGEKLPTSEHVYAMRELSRGERIQNSVGGSHQEDGWRGDFTQAGWRITEPTGPRYIEEGIQKVYSWLSLRKLKIFNTCPLIIDELGTYSREVDEAGQVIEDTIMDKQRYHFMDALRYRLGGFDAHSAGGTKRTSLPVSSQM